MTATPRFHPRTILVTGGAGFIGSNAVRWILEHDRDVHVVNLDLLTYAGNRQSLVDVEARFGPAGDGRHHFVHGDIRDTALLSSLLAGGDHPAPDAVLHLAAESHVDRSITSAAEFVSTNVQGTHALLACTLAELEARPRDFRFVNVSTDEVYGSLGPHDAPFTERHPLAPNSPYSASKAGADCLVRAYTETFGLPCITTRCSNNYGPYQYPEKLIPLMITRALAGEPLPVYGDGRNVRDWLHVRDHAAALWAVLTKGAAGAVYNIGGESERENIQVVRAVLNALDRPESLVAFVKDRPGHDRRYAMDITRIRTELGWSPQHTFDAGIAATVEWYVSNRGWWSPLVTPA